MKTVRILAMWAAMLVGTPAIGATPITYSTDFSTGSASTGQFMDGLILIETANAGYTTTNVANRDFKDALHGIGGDNFLLTLINAGSFSFNDAQVSGSGTVTFLNFYPSFPGPSTGFQTFTLTSTPVSIGSLFANSSRVGIRVDAGSSLVLDNLSVSVSAVPEPATWAMLIAGFGLVGAAMRRRPVVLVSRT